LDVVVVVVVFLDLLFSFDPVPGGAAMVGQSVNVRQSCMYLSRQGWSRRRAREEKKGGEKEGVVDRVSSRVKMER
jgi:hypothetical protein